MKRSLKWISFLLAIMLLGTMLVGCGNKEEKDQVDAEPEQQEDNTEDQDETKDGDKSDSADGKITDKDITLQYWVSLNPNAAASVSNLGETPLYQELEKQTGVKIEFLHPPAGQEEEQFNLMIASQELPDIIEHLWYNYPGGPEKALSDGVITNLDDIIDEYAPNLKKVLESDPMNDKLAKTDGGNYYMFPFVRGDDELAVFYGPIMRKDWLDELDLDIPETIEEWEEVLTAFKEKKGAPSPFIGPVGSIAYAYKVTEGFFLEDGQVKYGPIEPGYKEYLTTLNRWYEQGLLDPDYAALDGKAIDAKVTGGKTGAFSGYSGSSLGRYLVAMEDKDTSFELAGVPYIAPEKGEKAFYGQKDFPLNGVGAAITPQCEEKEIAAKLLDYGYSEAGHMLYNFGIEGESYKLDGDYPKYTEVIMKNPDGLSPGEALARYARSSYSGPFIQDVRYGEQYVFEREEQAEAISRWKEADDSHRLPPVTPTAEESEKLASIMNEINTYVEEMQIKFVMGQSSLDEFDSFVEAIKNMGIQEAIDIQQAALDRFNDR